MEGLKYCVLFRISSEFIGEHATTHTSNDLINIGFLVLFYKMFGYNYSEKYTFFFFFSCSFKRPIFVMKASCNLSFCIVQNNVTHVNKILVLFSKPTVNFHVPMQRYRENIHQSLYINTRSEHIINVY